MRLRTSLLSLLLLPAFGSAELADRQTYQPIIDAKPFGEMADETEPQSLTAAEEQRQKEEIAQKFRMCGITDTPDGERKIAFIDETKGAMASYLIGVGETQNGFTLLFADYDAATATLSKDGLTFTLGLGRGLIDDAAAAEERPAPPAPAAAAAPAPQRRTLPGAAAPAEAPAEGSFKARLIKRRAAEKAEAAEERLALQRRVAEAEADRIQANRRVQIERIKQGLAPTEPITLTPEEDAELEAAGVFGNRQPVVQPQPEGETSPAVQ